LFPFLYLLYLASLDNSNSFSSKHIMMTNSQKTREKEKVDLKGDSCCDDSCCVGASARFESEGKVCC
jgi:hypothetical protein